MKYKVTSALAIVSMTVFGSGLAAERAVEAVHYQASASGFNLNYDDGADTRALSIGAGLTLPVGRYFGSSLSGGYRDYSSFSYPEADIDVNALDGEIALFVRSPSLGRIGVSYERTRFEYDTTYKDPLYIQYFGTQDSSREYANEAAAMIEGYSGPVTVGVERARYEVSLQYGEDEVSYLTTLYGGWYVMPDLLFDVRATFDSSDDDAYQLGIEYQPPFLQSMAGISLSYLHASDADGFGLTFKFYFDKRFDLITRDRHYR